MAQLDQNAIDELLKNQQLEKETSDVQPSVDVISEIELDAIGESFNISMGAAAKSLSIMLNQQVLITTPDVHILKNSDFEYKSMVPAVGVKIDYIEGLRGSNFLVVKRQDIKKMVAAMIGDDAPPDDNEESFSDFDISAVSEIMNQMMGAASTALATFFNRKINISPPFCSEINSSAKTSDFFDFSDEIVSVKLKLIVGDLINSEIIHVMPSPFAKELANYLLETQLHHASTVVDEQDVTLEKAVPQQPIAKQVQQPPMQAQPPVQPRMVQQNIEPPNVQEAQFATFQEGDGTGVALTNFELIMDVPLEITVEIGKAKRQVREIMELNQGSIIELEKQAGDPVDIIVNGELIAKGDVVVIDDNFGVRITEVINKNV